MTAETPPGESAEDEEFWAQADGALAWRRSLSPEGRAELDARDAEVDALFDGL